MSEDDHREPLTHVEVSSDSQGNLEAGDIRAEASSDTHSVPVEGHGENQSLEFEEHGSQLFWVGRRELQNEPLGVEPSFLAECTACPFTKHTARLSAQVMGRELQVSCIARWRARFIPPRELLLANLIAGIIAGLKIVLGMVVFSNIMFNTTTHKSVNQLFPLGINVHLMSANIAVLTSVLFSSMPCLSTPQDIPAIIMSQMVEPLAEAVKDEAKLPYTVLACVWISALVGGVTSLVLGLTRVGGLFQRIPTPVVGGFTAAVGFSSIFSALSTMSGVQFGGCWPASVAPFRDALTWVHISLGFYTLVSIRYLPGWIKPRFKNPFLVSLIGPICLLSPLLLFYVVLVVRGQVGDDLATLRRMGWVYPVAEKEPFTALWRMVFNSHQVEWSALHNVRVLTYFVVLQLLSTLSAVFGMVGAATVLTERGRADIDRELRLMGVQNLLVGAVGGTYGYVQMGMSVNMLRDGGTHRLAHLTTFLFVFSVFMSGVSVTPYIPKFFLAGIFLNLGMAFISMHLIEQLGRMDLKSYASMWVIVICSRIWDLNVAVLVGGAVQIAIMIGIQGSMDPISYVGGTEEIASAKLRAPKEREVLRRSRLLLVVRLRGPLFFGCASQLLQRFDTILATAMPRPAFIILDLKYVTFVDDSAMQAITSVWDSARRMQVNLYFSGAGDWKWMLVRYGYGRYFDAAGGDGSPGLQATAPLFFEVLDDAIEACENRILQDFSLLQLSGPRIVASFAAADSPVSRNRVRLSSESAPESSEEEEARRMSSLPPDHWSQLVRYCERLDLPVDSSIFTEGSLCDSLFILLRGSVEVVRARSATNRRHGEKGARPQERLRRVVPLALLGACTMCSGRDKHSASAVVVSETGASLMELTKGELESMRLKDKELYCSFVHALLLPSLSTNVANLDGLNRC